MALVATACLAENVKSDFPPGLDPLLDPLDAVNLGLAEFPDGGVGVYPEQLGPFVKQTVGAGDPSCGDCQLQLVYAKGYLRKPLTDVLPATGVWAAGVVPQTSAEAASSVDTCSITLNVEKGYDYSWMVSYTKTQAIVTVDFDVTWRSGTLPWPTPAGGPPSPLQVAWRFQKTNGTAYIKSMAGSVLAYEVVPGSVTGLEFIRHVQATQSPPDVVASGIQNHYDNIKAQLYSTPFTNRLCTGP
jgi:hypothetical protein